MARLLFGLLLVIGLVAGSPYAALALSSIMGTSSSTFVDFDGSQQTLTMGRNLPQPDWLPDPQKSLLVKASHWAPSVRALEAGGKEILVHADAAYVRQFYTRELAQRGFKVFDEGIGPLNPGAAALLAIEGTLQAERPETGHEVSIHIRSPDGLILRPRLIQITWTQHSPEQKAARDALRKGTRGGSAPNRFQ